MTNNSYKLDDHLSIKHTLGDVGGIYQIRNIINNKIYVGSTIKLWRRLRTHLSSLKKNVHDSSHLQRAFNKYGPSNFLFEILEFENNQNILFEREQIIMDKTQCYQEDHGYNMAINSVLSMAGRKHSPETLIKMRKALTGKHHTEETKKRLSIAHTGKKLTKEHIEHRSEAQSKTWEFVDPQGNVVVIKNLKKFCREHNFHFAHMHNVYYNINHTNSCNGWRRVSEENIGKVHIPRGDWKNKPYTLVDPQGNIININNVQELSDKHGITPEKFYFLLKGFKKSIEDGWRMFNGSNNVQFDSKYEKMKKVVKLIDPNGNIIIIKGVRTIRQR